MSYQKNLFGVHGQFRFKDLWQGQKWERINIFYQDTFFFSYFLGHFHSLQNQMRWFKFFFSLIFHSSFPILPYHPTLCLNLDCVCPLRTLPINGSILPSLSSFSFLFFLKTYPLESVIVWMPGKKCLNIPSMRPSYYWNRVMCGGGQAQSAYLSIVLSLLYCRLKDRGRKREKNSMLVLYNNKYHTKWSKLIR